MGITDTQYLLVRHLDQPHPHRHLVYNRIGNKRTNHIGQKHQNPQCKGLSRIDREIRAASCAGKRIGMSEHLREPDKTKYEIYDAIKTCLSNCGNWDDLKLRLKEYGIAMRYKYCGSTNQKQGVLFSKNGFEFSGSKIDRQFSYSKLNRHFTQAQQQTQYRTTLAKGFHAAIGQLSVGIHRPIRQCRWKRE